jgi:hypothetical protein
MGIVIAIVIADKGYDADSVRSCIRDHGAIPNIPNRSNRKTKFRWTKAIIEVTVGDLLANAHQLLLLVLRKANRDGLGLAGMLVPNDVDRLPALTPVNTNVRTLKSVVRLIGSQVPDVAALHLGSDTPKRHHSITASRGHHPATRRPR